MINEARVRNIIRTIRFLSREARLELLRYIVKLFEEDER